MTQSNCLLEPAPGHTLAILERSHNQRKEHGLFGDLTNSHFGFKKKTLAHVAFQILRDKMACSMCDAFSGR